MRKTTSIALIVAGMLCMGGISMADTPAEPTRGNTALADQKCDDSSTGKHEYDSCMEHHHGDRGYRIRERLHLTEQQQVSFRDIKKKYFGESESEFKKVWQLKKELAQESLKKNTDKKKIEGLADAIGKQHVRLALSESRFLTEVATVLTPDQIQRFLKMKEGHFHGGGFRK